jgi:hypothetical protein
MALKAIIKTIQPEFLQIPENLLELLPPRAVGSTNSNENFRKKTGLTFDPLGAAESAAELSIRLLLNPQRASRLIEYKSRNQDLPGLNDVLSELIKNSWKNNITDPYLAEINRTVSKLVLTKLLFLAENQLTAGQVRAITLSEVLDLEEWMQKAYTSEKDSDQKAHLLYGMELIRRYKENPELFKSGTTFPLPAGSPIGNGLLNCEF